MVHLKLKHNFVIVDDDLPTVQSIGEQLGSYDHWRDNPISIKDSTIELEPEVRLVTPGKAQRLNQFLQTVRNTLFGAECHAAALCDHYIPSTVFLIDWRFDKFSWDFNEGNKPDGLMLCAEIKELIPHSFCCLVTAHDVMETTESDSENVDFLISKTALASPAGQTRLAKQITRHFVDLLESPTWDGLLDYADGNSDTYHAMAVGGSSNETTSSRGFLQRFGANLFAAEASLTLKPLDSLLSPAPNGCIARSETLFARAFGARKARFGTNGTSGANTILWMTLFNPDDLVLVDRNCHISHHYSAARQGVTPIYLEPEVEVTPDVFGPPSLATIKERIEFVCANGLGHRLKGIVLTNCTFDGNLLNPKSYIEEIDGLLRKLLGNQQACAFVYFFDEAWFSFARFDPGLIRYTAMYAAERVKLPGGRPPRVYATQSIHKTLTAFRQASIILERDEWPSEVAITGLDHPRFKQSYLANTTTSPSAPIVASFDIARRQMSIDGAAMIRQGALGAREFALSLQGNSWAKVGSILRQGPISQKRVKSQFPKDPTKLTLFHRLNKISGEAKKLLWENAQIQVNKFGYDSVMFMFMPGYERSKTPNVLRRLAKLADTNLVEVNSKKPKAHSLRLGLDRCVDQRGEVHSYPIGVAKSGRIGMGHVLFGPGSDGAIHIGAADIVPEAEFICCSFVTPYPPGFPILVPGQIVDGASLIKILQSEDEIHGIDDEKRILVKLYSQPPGASEV